MHEQTKDEKNKKSKYTPPPKGIQNIGNTWFMNSILQWTRATPLFHEYFLEDQKYKDDLEKGTEVENTMASLYTEITMNQGRVNTTKIIL